MKLREDRLAVLIRDLCAGHEKTQTECSFYTCSVRSLGWLGVLSGPSEVDSVSYMLVGDVSNLSRQAKQFKAVIEAKIWVYGDYDDQEEVAGEPNHRSALRIFHKA